ncbi:MAG: hypothetical protein Q8P41_06965, partial [Pseudomonadota bacterium]|nr:hypothetical protein [Pseudomonadota bacterium]
HALMLVAPLLTLLLAAPPAHAGPLSAFFELGVTYCVGGYDGTPPRNADACGQPAQRRGHGDWHHHNFVTDGKQCWSCWDEEDSTCDTSFLFRNPTWQAIDPESPRCKNHPKADTIFQHVVDGQDRVAPTPPPTVLRPTIDHVSPGPYSVDDTVTIQASVRDDQGAVHAIPSGYFVVEDGVGPPKNVPARVRPDGTVVADIVLPASASPRITFVPTAPTLGKHERMGGPTSAPLAFTVDVCAFRARVLAPAAGAALASGQPTTLRATLFDKADAVPAPTPKASSLTFTLSLAGAPDVTVPADANLQATWTPPPSPTPRTLTIRAGGTADGRVACPAKGVAEATVSDIGIGFDTSDLPGVCYVGMPCGGNVSLVRPESGAARQRVDAILADPATTVVLYDNGAEVARSSARPDDRYRFDGAYTSVSSHSWRLEILPAPVGGVAAAPIVMPPVEVRVRLPLKVVLEELLDFGTVAAGTPWSQTCKPLDMSRSQAAMEHGWELEAVGSGACKARPVFGYQNANGDNDKMDLGTARRVAALDPAHPFFLLCLDVPSCADDRSPPDAGLRVMPLTPEFAAEQKTVALRWQVTGVPWYRCHAAWLGPSALLALSGLVLLGLLRPARFSPSATVKVAGSEKGLKKSSALVLVECPGASAGFYRDAALGLHADGDVNGRTRNALVRLRATRGPNRLILLASVPVEVYDPRTRAWKDVPDGRTGHAPSPRAIYRCGSTCFQVDPG